MKMTQLLLGKMLVTGKKSKGNNTSLKINNKTPRNNIEEKKIEENEFDGQTQCN
jgi:hypothetical protein